MELFEEYYKQFDSSDWGIYYKHDHSYRVMEYAIEIRKSLNFNERDLYIIKLAGLYHDIGRFTQWTNYKTFVDHESVDHGDEGEKIFKEYFIDKYDLTDEEKDIILKSIKYHNKKVFPDFGERINTFINITRDADKLDIMDSQLFEEVKEEIIIKKELVDPILKHDVCDKKLVITNTDEIIRFLSWINDFNYDYSYKVLRDKKLFETHLELINNGSEEFNRLKEYIKQELEKRN